MKVTKKNGRVLIDLTAIESDALDMLISEGATGLLTDDWKYQGWPSKAHYIAGCRIANASFRGGMRPR